MKHNRVLLAKGVDADAFSLEAQALADQGFLLPSLTNESCHTAMIPANKVDTITVTAPTNRHLRICLHLPRSPPSGMKGVMEVL